MMDVGTMFRQTRLREKGDRLLMGIDLCPQVFVKTVVRLYEVVGQELSFYYRVVDADLLNKAYAFLLSSPNLDLTRIHKGRVFAKHFWLGRKEGRKEFSWVAFWGAVDFVLANRIEEVEHAQDGPIELQLTGLDPA